MTFTLLVSPGEFFDRLTILTIKETRLPQGARRQAVTAQVEAMHRDWARARISTDIIPCISRLQIINERLWAIEDRLREFESQKKFMVTFIECARAVYQLNDERSAIKREIDRLLGADSEPKLHPEYAKPE